MAKKKKVPDLPTGPFSGTGRQILTTLDPRVLAHMAESANEVGRLAAEVEKTDPAKAAQLQALRHGMMIDMEKLSLGTRTTLDVNLRSQESTPNWDDLPPEIQEAAAKVLDHMQRPVPVLGTVLERKALTGKKNR